MAINTYQEKWENRSSIRTRPRKIIDFNQRGVFFPPSKQTLLMLPEIAQLGEKTKAEILLHSFYKYLNDIINLEIKLINEVCYKIVHGELTISYPEEIKLNAYTVIIDEYYHVYLAKDMMNQLDNHFSNFNKLKFPISDAYYAVESICEKLDPKYRDMFKVIAVCIFETTLVRELVEFFNDKEVHPSIKYYVNDHINDESKHYGFFYELLEFTWNNLPEDYKKEIGQHLGDFVKLYLNVVSEKHYNYEILNLILRDNVKAKKLIEKIYQDFDILIEMPIVRNVLTVLKKTNIMNHQFVKLNFIKNKLYL